MTQIASRPQVGSLLREWRVRRRMSQLDLSLETGVSTRHLSFIETGRSRPSARMVLTLAAELDVPLRARNDLLLAAGYAPAFAQNDLDAPAMGPARRAIDELLAAHEPAPALVVDRHWGMLAANRAVGALLEGVAPSLLEPPVNVLRLSLHPEGLAPRIANLGQWRAHLLERLGRDAIASGDPALRVLADELAGYPGGEQDADLESFPAPLAVPLRLRPADGRAELSFISTVTTFGTAADVTLAELSIETFLPADAQTALTLRELLARRPGSSD